MFYCLTDTAYILYDKNIVTDVFVYLGIKWHNENMPDVFDFFLFLPSDFSSDISARIIKTYIFICCIKQNYKTVETSVKQWQKQCVFLRS